MKTIIAIFLTITLLVSSLLASVGLSTKYVMRPYEYAERFVRVFDNSPLNNNKEPEFWGMEKPTYYDLGLKLPTWNSIAIDSVTAIPSAISVFMNRSMTYVGAVVKECLSIIPKIGANAKMMMAYYIGPVPQLFVYVAKEIKSVFEMKAYITALALAAIPLDWLEIQKDEVDLRLPWFGSIGGIPLEIYYTYKNNIEDGDTDSDIEGDVGGDMEGDIGEGNTGNPDNIGTGNDFTLEEYDPNLPTDPDFNVPDTGDPTDPTDPDFNAPDTGNGDGEGDENDTGVT